MSILKAFVGHSFTGEDEDVVRKFLDYFTQIQNMGIGFSWDHARVAEPKDLAEKVLQLIEGKNLFIGICTKKEKVINADKLKSKFFSKSKQCGMAEDFFWKTSDWVIQEIGLAKGRGLNLILLVEEGVRKPGGLQGNLEYIQFSRETPADSFGRILEMIQALLPHAKPIEEAIAGKPKPAEEDKNKGRSDEWNKPKPEWKRRDYEFALLHMVGTEDEDGEQVIIEAYLNTEDGKKAENINSWAAVREYMHILLSKDGSLGKLEGLAKEHSDNSEAQRYLAKTYEQLDEYEKAADSYMNSAKNEKETPREMLRMLEAAKAMAKAKKQPEVDKLIKQVKEKSALIEDGEVELLKGLIDIADIQNDHILGLAYMERLLDLRPGDFDTRFNLAYGHSDAGRNSLSLLHYLKIPNQNRSAVTWNNIGVEYARLDIDGKAVDAYRASEEMEETLAMDNIARKFLDNGFFKEAHDQCDKARKYEGYNKNVDETLFRLKKAEEDEDKKETELLDTVKSVHEFYVRFGRASAKENISDFKGSWKDSKCELNLEVCDNKFKASGEYEVTSLGLIMGALGGSQEKPKYKITYEGKITGYAVVGKVKVTKLGEEEKASSLLAQDDDAKDILLVISDDVKTISLYQEGATYESQKFQVLEKI